MPFKTHDRQYDLVIFGATGYTGLMTVEHVAAHFPTDLKWAVAGRSADKLKKVVSACKPLNVNRVPPDIEVCTLNDAELLSLAKKTFVFISTVGPFSKYGEPAFKACAEAGTHYLDSTGESVWVCQMLRKYEKKAKGTGAIMIPQDGIESAPSDLLTWSMAQLIKSQLSTQVGDAVVEFHETHSSPSGGTLASVLGIFDVFSLKEFAAALKYGALSPVKPPPAPKSSMASTLTGLRTVPGLGLLTPSVASTTNAAIVMRTWGLLQQEPSRQGQAYGPKFAYQDLIKARNWLSGMMMYYGTLLGGALVFIPPVRSLIRHFVYKPGEGPDKKESIKEYFELRGLAKSDDPNVKKGAFVRASYTGSMYYLTAALLAQGALTILQDDLDLQGGVYTPACLGKGYIDRLDDAGFKIDTKLVDI